jgi:hypothetical protein
MNQKNIDWINFSDSFALKVGYKYNGTITVPLSIAFIVNPMGFSTHGFRTCHNVKQTKLTNPVLRPFRKIDGVFEFGIHDRQENTNQDFSSVVPFFRFRETELKKDGRFNKVEISELQEHEIIIQNGIEKAHKMNNEIVFEALLR